VRTISEKRPPIPADADGYGRAEPRTMYPQMEGQAVFKNAVERLLVVLDESLQKPKLAANDVDLLCFHQANLRINDYVRDHLHVPAEKVINNIERHGDTTAATLPSLLFEAEESGRLQRGMKVVLAAFGAGFTWGCSVIDW
jgi:3-oxoacyl-[acyl-carrier-protein] synthase III